MTSFLGGDATVGRITAECTVFATLSGAPPNAPAPAPTHHSCLHSCARRRFHLSCFSCVDRVPAAHTLAAFLASLSLTATLTPPANLSVLPAWAANAYGIMAPLSLMTQLAVCILASHVIVHFMTFGYDTETVKAALLYRYGGIPCQARPRMRLRLLLRSSDRASPAARLCAPRRW